MWRRWLCLIALAHGYAWGQERQFEVVSVRYVGAYDTEKTTSLRGGPGTSDPAHIVWENALMLHGFPVLPPGAHHALFQPIEDGVQVTRETFRDFSMAELVQELAWPLGEHPSWEHVLSVGRVVDKTGLRGKYDFKLYYAGAHHPGGALPQPGRDGEPGVAPTLFDALRQQLGLKLQETKALTT